jgi:hypothetical protein
MLVEVGREPIERPASKGQSEVLGAGERTSKHLRDLLGLVDGRPSLPGPIFQSLESSSVEALDPAINALPSDRETPSDLCRVLSFERCGNRLRSFNEPRCGRARPSQLGGTPTNVQPGLK